MSVQVDYLNYDENIQSVKVPIEKDIYQVITPVVKKEHIIFSMKLAGYLMQRGFVIKRMEKSTRKGNENRNIFIFNSSEDLLTACEEYADTK